MQKIKHVSFFKKGAVWMVATFLIYLLLATLIMFSRETTLHGVRGFDYKIFAQSLNVIDDKDKGGNLRQLTNVLTIKNGQKVFFPIALLGKDFCSENGNRTNGLCTKYPNIDAFESTAAKVKPRKRYDQTIFDLPNGESYFYKKIDENHILIGEAGKYLSGNQAGALFKFLKDDWHNYFLTMYGEDGKYGGIHKTWQKTSDVFWLTFIISLVLFLMYLWIDHKNKRAYLKLKNIVKSTNDKLYNLNNEFNTLMQKRIEIENRIITIKQKFGDSAIQDNEEVKLLNEEEKEIDKKLSKKKDEIIALENIDDVAMSALKEKADKISTDMAYQELENLIEKLHNIKKLWHRELSWEEREKIEQQITGHKQKIPFTLSQSFILFEKSIVYRQAKKCKEFEEGMSLLEMIKLIVRCQKIDKDVSARLHEIRRARNKWMHYAIFPSEEVIEDLIMLLQKFKVEPDI